MIKSTIVKCNFCNEKILLRFQIGYFNIPCDFSCPNCDVSIHGIKKINKNNLIISNAKEISEEINNARFYGNFSTEFLNKKVSKFNCLEDIINNGTSPFMNTTMMFEDYKKCQNIMEKMGKFLRFKESFLNKINPLHELFFNKKIDLIEKPLLEFSENYIIKNELDAEIALHQLITMGMNHIMPSNTLKEYTDSDKEQTGVDTDKALEIINSDKFNVVARDILDDEFCSNIELSTMRTDLAFRNQVVKINIHSGSIHICLENILKMKKPIILSYYADKDEIYFKKVKGILTEHDINRVLGVLVTKSAFTSYHRKLIDGSCDKNVDVVMNRRLSNSCNFDIVEESDKYVLQKKKSL